MIRFVPLCLLLAACATRSAPAPEPAEAASVDPLSSEGISMTIESALDRTVDPCDDFYRFTCGTWLDTTEMPADRPRVSRGFTAIYDGNQEVVKQILSDAASGTLPADARLGAYYDACMDTSALDAAGPGRIKVALDGVRKVSDAASLMTVLGANPMMDAFFSGGVEADFKNPDINILHIAQGGLGLPNRDFYFPTDDKGTEMLAAYEAHVGTMLQMFNFDAADAEKVLAIELKLAEASRTPAEMRNVEKLYDKMDLAGLEALTPTLPWKTLLTELGAPDLVDINVMTPEFFPVFESIVAEGDWPAIKAYLSWQFIRAAAPYLGTAIDEANFAFYGTVMNGQQEQQPRWKRCVDRTDGAVGDLLGQAYVDRAFPGDSKAKASAMIADIQAAFEGRLPKLDWMDNTTRKAALQKLGTITNKIGYPDSWEAYENLALDGDHFAHQMALSTWNMAKELAKVGQAVDKAEWHMTPPTVNAYYNPLVNEIVFPAGIMQPPFFSNRYPTAMNYGAMGMVMGHEVTHGFDDEGRKFGPDGSMREWWAPEVSEAFEGRAQCVVDLYSDMEILPGQFINGELTLGENIADIGGIRLAHEAYKSWKAAGNTEEGLAGFTPEQLVFVAYAQSWCTKATDEFMANRLKTDPHSPPMSRVNGPLSQLPAFGKAFECEVGSPMRPEETCVVW